MSSLRVLTTFLLLATTGFAQTVSEKKSEFKPQEADFTRDTERLLDEVNSQVLEKREELKRLYTLASQAFSKNTSDPSVEEYRKKIAVLKEEISALQQKWYQAVKEEQDEEKYALWFMPDSTLDQLIIDYADSDHLYIIPDEIAKMKVNIHSALPIPRGTWTELVDSILSQLGVGVRELSPTVRQLYLAKDRPSSVLHMTSRQDELDYFYPDSRVCFILNPKPDQMVRTQELFTKFLPAGSTLLIRSKELLFLIGEVEEIQELLKIYSFVSDNKAQTTYELIPLNRLTPQDAETILKNLFYGEKQEKTALPEGPHIMILQDMNNAIYISGSKDEVAKSKEILEQLESQASGVKEKTLFWYTCKHSDPEDIAMVLERVYQSVLEIEQAAPQNGEAAPSLPPVDGSSQLINPVTTFDDPNISHVINLSGEANLNDGDTKKGFESKNFIVDAKTGSIIMVVEQFALPRLKELLRKIDVPKKMVQIDVILVEKSQADSTNFGVNFLKMGEAASGTHGHETRFRQFKSGESNVIVPGLFEFLIKRKKSDSFPAFDLAYNFLLTQENIRVTTNPSVLAVNQTEAKIAILDEISLSTGFVEIGSNNNLKDSRTRAQFGTLIEITPTVHMRNELEDEEEDSNYVTLKTKVNFDTPKGGVDIDDRVPFVRREIKNEVRVADGQTVILGGLKNVNSLDGREKIPFLGELPGIGKLFSFTTLQDITSEMFIFITPTIICDPKEEIAELYRKEAMKRPGDTPEFMCLIEEVRCHEREHLFDQSLRALFGH